MPSNIFMRLKTQWSKSKFLKNVLTLMVGTSLAQAVSIAVSPILTRLFTPDEFGVFALYGALISTISVIVTLRYEMAIVQPQNDEDAHALLYLSIYISAIISLILFFFIWFFNSDIVAWFNSPSLTPWLYLLPISVLLTGVYQAFSYLNIRHENYKAISTAQISQSISASSSQILFNSFAISGGLIWGQFLGLCVASGMLIKKTLPKKMITILMPSFERIICNAKSYKKFPLYSTVGAIANSLSAQMPILFLAKYFESSATGFFSLTYRVLTLPMTLISQALSQVIYQRVSAVQHTAPALIKPQIIKLMTLLFLLMIPFIFIIWFFGEALFVFVFGEAWREAGHIARILVFAVAFRFPVSALSTVLALDNTIKLGVLWQIIYFFTISLTLFYFSNRPLYMFLNAFVIHEIFLSIIYGVFILKARFTMIGHA